MFTGKGKQLTIFIGESDQYHHQALHMAIVEMLRRAGCSGATVTRGVAGFGASSLIHTATILRLSLDLPIVITVVEHPERIERILGPLREMAPAALIVVHDVEVVQSGAPFKEGLPDVTVAEVMRQKVTIVDPDSPITRVIELLLDKGFTALPVVDGAGKLVGMVSDNDLLARGGMRITISLKRATNPEFVRGLHESLEDPHHKVSEVMTTDVVTARPDMVLGRAARLMVEKHVKRLPVVDESGKVMGILGRLDILNTIAAVHLPQWHSAARAPVPGALVGEVMTREVPTVPESATLEQIFELLVASTHKRVVVVDEHSRVSGIIADSDLISRVTRESWPSVLEVLVSKVPIEKIAGSARRHLQKLRARTAKELMTPDIITVQQEMPVASALALSATRRVKRLPVVNVEGKLVGIVGRTEMMRALLAGSRVHTAPRVLQILLVALGGGIGSAARYVVGGWFAIRFGAAFPYGTLVINVTGSFIIGLFLAFARDRIWLGPNWRVFFAVGLVGGYTTFSTFEYETIRLLQDGQMLLGMVYLFASVLTGAMATIGGIALGSSIQ